MPRIEVDERIERPIEDVWAYVSNPHTHVQWQSSAREREVITDGPLGKGTRIRSVDQFLGRKMEYVTEVTEWEPNRCFSLRQIEGPVPSEMHVAVEQADGGTALTVEAIAEAGLGGFFGKMAEPLLVKIFRRQLTSELGTLKDLLENR